MALVTYSGTMPVDIRGVPLFSGKTPGVADFKPIQGGKVLTDSLGEDSIPMRMEVVSNSKATYSYITQGLLPYATPTDWVVLRGSATKLVKVVRVSFVGFATAATNINFTLRTHSVANTAGTSTTPAIIQRDSTDAAPTASILLYSVAPTISGTAVIVENVWTQLAVALTGTSVLPVPFVHEYGGGPFEPYVLRGVAQEFALNFGGAAVPAGSTDYYEIVWTEE